MSIISIITKIHAPAPRVFDLARSVDLHVQSSGSSREIVFAGVRTGFLELGQEVTWRGRHFGVWQNLTSRITRFSRPDYFRDSMVRGAFQRLDHDHFFEAEGDWTIMKDVFDFSSPLGVIGRMTDALFLKAYMRRFLIERNNMIRKTAEGTNWKLFFQN